MKCLICDVPVEVILDSIRAKIPDYEVYEFRDVHYKCKQCGYDFNCVGSKTLNS